MDWECDMERGIVGDDLIENAMHFCLFLFVRNLTAIQSQDPLLDQRSGLYTTTPMTHTHTEEWGTLSAN